MSRLLLLLSLSVLLLAVGCYTPQFISFSTFYPPKIKLPKGTKVAVIPKGADLDAADRIARRLEKYLIQDPDRRFKVIEREALADIMEERALAETGLLEKDAELLSKLKMKGVEALIIIKCTEYSADIVKTVKQEKVTEKETGAAFGIYKGKVVPIAGGKKKTRHVPVEYYTVIADVEATFKMVNVGTASIIAVDSASGSFKSPPARGRLPDISKSQARDLAIDNCIAQFMQWIGWRKQTERYELAKPPNEPARIGNNLASQNLYGQAEGQFRAALKSAPDPLAKAAILYNLGLALEAEARYEEALSCYNEAVRLTGGASKAYGNSINRVNAKIRLGGQATPGSE